MKVSKTIFIVAAMLFFVPLQAQELRGTVCDGDGRALVGASVYWDGTTVGTATDRNGAFLLHRVKNYNRLVASYLGYRNDTITVETGADKVDFALSAEGNTLEEIVVTGTQQGNFIRHDGIAKQEMISFAGLTKLACCNLAESFENSASVTVGYSDAISGARQIKMLGLAGTYTQILDESRPIMRGLSSPYGLNYTPGMWLGSIQVSKGVASVAAGHDAVTGQINLEYRKPTDRERLFVNLYADDNLRPEANISMALPVTRDGRLSTVVLLHGSTDNPSVRMDHNGDGFRDLPCSDQINAANRWLYSAPDGMQIRWGWRFVQEHRLGGNFGYEDGMRDNMADAWDEPNTLYGSRIGIRNANAYLKIARPVGASVYDADDKMELRSNLAFVADFEHFAEDAYFGLNDYRGRENTISANLMYNRYFSERSSLMSGVQARLSDYGESLLNPTPWLTPEAADYVFDRREGEVGGYAEYTFSLKDKFTAVAGLRGDYNAYYDMFFLTPRGHMKWNITPSTVLRGSAGLGYRSTNILTDNIGILATGRRIIFEDGRADFRFDSFNRMEKALTAGGSLTQSFSLAGTDNASVSIDYFRTRFYNSVAVDQEWSATDINIYAIEGTAVTDTYQLDLSWMPAAGWDIFATFRYTDGRMPLRRADGTVVTVERPLVSRYKTLLNVQYATKFRLWVFDFTAQLNGAARIPTQTGNLSDDSMSPAYPVFFAQITHKIGLCDIYAGCENIGDFTQKVPISGADAPFSSTFNSMNVWGPLMGRKIYLGLRFNMY